ncbi:bacterial Ig-like domain-containing protein, partial [uncultured Oscillibacter sp.]|uniref:bacterial Ig-like domain-containing protein n=1 Tax=uncultured Oscillibacter sp. TaxID=876091 RepID=UPI0025F71C82
MEMEVSTNTFYVTPWEAGTFPIRVVVPAKYSSTGAALEDTFTLTATEDGVPPDPTDPTVTAIAIATPANKTVYTLGEPLDVAGLTITAALSDGNTETVPVNADMVSGFDSSTAGVKTLTITYGGQTTSYQITVRDDGGTPPDPTDPTVTAIAIATPANKTVYTLGEPLDVAGLTITAALSDGNTETVPVNADMVSGFDSSTAGVKTLTIMYQGQTTTYQITVRDNGGTPPDPTDPTVTAIAIATPANKTVYTLGEPLDVAGLTITAALSDGNTETVPVNADMVSGFDSSTAGVKTLTIMYQGQTTTYQITVR